MLWGSARVGILADIIKLSGIPGITSDPRRRIAWMGLQKSVSKASVSDCLSAFVSGSKCLDAPSLAFLSEGIHLTCRRIL